MLQPCNKIFTVTGKSVAGKFVWGEITLMYIFFTTVPRYFAARLA